MISKKLKMIYDINEDDNKYNDNDNKDNNTDNKQITFQSGPIKNIERAIEKI